MVTIAEQAMADVKQILLEAGFVDDGESIAGRKRYVKRGTNIKATVGKRTTAIYRIEGPGLNGVRSLASLSTRDLGGLRALLQSLSA